MKNLPTFRLLFLIWTICVLPISSIFGQPGTYINHIPPTSAARGSDVALEAELSQPALVSSISLYFRPSDQFDFIEREMTIIGNTARVGLSAEEVKPPFIEYYFIILTTNGESGSYPVHDPEINPLRLTIDEADRRDSEVVILSPQHGERLQPEDVLVSISLIYASHNVDKAATRLYVNDIDYTEYAVKTDDIVLLIPSNISDHIVRPGQNNVKVELRRTDGSIYHTKSWQFTTITPERIAIPSPEAFRYNLSLEGESRNETLAGHTEWYNRSRITFRGGYPWLRLRSNLYVTNEERSTRQPQNRYFIGADTDWLRLGLGDTYPTSLPSLFMAGRRLRGIDGRLRLGFFNLDIVTGEVVRSIEGREIDRIPAFIRVGETLEPVPIPPNSRYNPTDSTYVILSYGMHKRTVTAVRPSFGKRQSFQLGFSYLYGKDDVASIAYGTRPAENVVVGSDLFLSFDRRRIELTGQVAMSVSNLDISKDDLTREELADIIGEGGVREIEQIISLSTLRRFITINEHLTPLDPRRLSSLAYELHLRLNYFRNFLQVGYIRRGNDYTSFGLTTLRRDVQGLQLRDRIRLYQNQLYIDVRAEFLQDNLAEQKTHTTKYRNYLASVSYIPRTNLPSLTLGYGAISSDNEVNLDQPSAINDVTRRIFISATHNLQAGGLRHNGIVTLNYSQRDDKTFRDADVDIFNILAIVNTYFNTVPLQTTIGANFYFSEIPALPDEIDQDFSFIQRGFNYTSIILSGRYRLLENKLTLHAGVTPTFGDFERTAFQAGAQYALLRNLFAVFSLEYLINPATDNDVVTYLTLKFDM